MSTLQQIAEWKSHNNPLERVVGGGGISPTILARSQEDFHAQMILIAENYKGQNINLREDYREMSEAETKIKEPKRYRIRILTENECFRLMGVKDEDFKKITFEQYPNSQYHLAGDSIVTTVLMAIFGELLEVDYKDKIAEVIKDITKECRDDRLDTAESDTENHSRI